MGVPPAKGFCNEFGRLRALLSCPEFRQMPCPWGITVRATMYRGPKPHTKGVSSRPASTYSFKEFSRGTAAEVPYGRGTPLDH